MSDHNYLDDLFKIDLHSTPYEEDVFPLIELCAIDALPSDPLMPTDVSWKSVTFASIAMAVAISSLQLGCHYKGLKQHIYLPEGNVKHYLSRMDYLNILDIKSEESFDRRDPDDCFVPLRIVPIDEYSADVNGIAERIARHLEKTTVLSVSARYYINYLAGEIIDNIIQHSRAKSPGVVGAQWYSGRRFTDICFADCGVGIAETMKENPLYSGLDNSRLLMKAFEFGTGQWFERSDFGTNKVSAGKGLSYLSGLVATLGGRVWVVSRSEGLLIDSDGMHIMSNLWYPGTVIVMRIPDISYDISDSEIDPSQATVFERDNNIGLW